jgi:hypothetical protein
MEQEPLRVYPTAHFSVALVRSKTFKQRELVRANLLEDPWDHAPGARAVCVVIISKLRTQQVLFCMDTG